MVNMTVRPRNLMWLVMWCLLLMTGCAGGTGGDLDATADQTSVADSEVAVQDGSATLDLAGETVSPTDSIGELATDLLIDTPHEDVLEDLPEEVQADVIEKDYSGPDFSDVNEPCPTPTGYVEVAAGDLIADPGAFDGQKVAVVTALVVPGADCDAVECGPGEPCCAGCFGVYYFKDAPDHIQVISGGVTEVGCPGNNCDWMDSCAPFELDKPYQVWGTLGAGMFNSGALYVDGFCEP